ncbi:hypothetical protein, partial [Plasticicumulans sp.]|uniref:hypothetical protein n=1 Tax=Plasticicumulans sp. TaxID=2307179 RepID=UPI002D1FC13F
ISCAPGSLSCMTSTKNRKLLIIKDKNHLTKNFDHFFTRAGKRADSFSAIATWCFLIHMCLIHKQYECHPGR